MPVGSVNPPDEEEADEEEADEEEADEEEGPDDLPSSEEARRAASIPRADDDAADLFFALGGGSCFRRIAATALLDREEDAGRVPFGGGGREEGGGTEPTLSCAARAIAWGGGFERGGARLPSLQEGVDCGSSSSLQSSRKADLPSILRSTSTKFVCFSQVLKGQAKRTRIQLPTFNRFLGSLAFFCARGHTNATARSCSRPAGRGFASGTLR